MSTQSLGWTPFFTLVHKEILRFIKVVGQTVLSPIVNSTLYLLIFGVSLGGQIQMSNGFTYLAFLIPGLVMMAALNNAYQNSSSSIIGSKFHGDLQDLRTVPISGQEIVWAMSFAGLVRGSLVGFLTFLVGQAFYFYTESQLITIAHPGLLAFFICVGTFSFAMLGIAVGFYATGFEKINAIGSFILLPLMYLGGVFFSLQNLHPVWQMISKANPLFYFINGIRYSFLGVSDIPIETAAVVSIFSLIVMLTIATRCVRHGSYARW